jgi:hypothetical protein
MSRDRMVSSACLREHLQEVVARAEEHAPFLPDYARKRDEWLLAEFQRVIREAETQYVSTGEAAQLTGWDQQTVRKYARLAVEGAGLPEAWSRLVALREGRDYSVMLSTVPVGGRRHSRAA